MQRTIPLRRRDTPQRSWTRPSSGIPFRSPLLFGALTLAATFAEVPEAQATSFFRWENRRENVGTLRLIPELSSFSTTENYDATGAKTPVASLMSYKKTGADIWGVYGISPLLTAYARLSLASVSFETASFTGSGSGLTEQALGLNYRLWSSLPARDTGGGAERSSSIDGQFQLDIPLYDNVSLRSASPRQPLRGDGTLDLTIGGFGTLPINQGTGQRIYGILGLGYSIRNANYSTAIPYQLQVVGLPEQTGFLYRFGFHGYKSMTSDPATGTAISPQAVGAGVPPVDSQDAGRSLIVDALNSSYLTVRATGGYQWKNGGQLYATLVLPMSGTSTASLKGIIVGAQFRMGAGTVGTSTGYTKTLSAGYDLEARVKQANDRLNLIKIDRGSNEGFAKGNVIDVYRTNSDGSPVELIARGVITSVSDTESVVNLRQYKKEVWVQPGYVARRMKTQKTP